MAVIELEGVTYRYGRVAALRSVDLEVPEGALYALLGPNGAGKTTLLEILAGLRRPSAGRASLLGTDISQVTASDRARVVYVAADPSLPGWMTLRQLESYVAPLYPGWDPGLAGQLRERFRLDPRRKIRTLSRGERMKAAMLCALSPRPRLLLLDEPFTGMDALVKDELVRGLLESAGENGWTVLVCSHDIGELEALADWVGFLDEGVLALSEPMESLRSRFRRVEVVVPGGGAEWPSGHPPEWEGVEVSGPRITFLLRLAPETGSDREVRTRLLSWFPEGARIEIRNATLREIFVGLARGGREERAAVEEVA